GLTLRCRDETQTYILLGWTSFLRKCLHQQAEHALTLLRLGIPQVARLAGVLTAVEQVVVLSGRSRCPRNLPLRQVDTGDEVPAPFRRRDRRDVARRGPQRLVQERGIGVERAVALWRL